VGPCEAAVFLGAETLAIASNVLLKASSFFSSVAASLSAFALAYTAEKQRLSMTEHEQNDSITKGRTYFSIR